MASWQVDIPSLSQLVLGAGAHGLKQLTQAGVDIHTVGCMLAVGEHVPASHDFRASLHIQRGKQRNERQWLFNLVEIGAGSSFLVDYLLKTRAGENVLALLVATAPLMSPESCSTVLSALFENAAVSSDNTPGLGQFRKLRDALVSFARCAGFQERVMQYHCLFERILRPQPATVAMRLPEYRSPFNAIPDTHTLSRIIQFCHKIATSEDITVLIFTGFRGSGWIAAYTTCILGFSVCAIDGAGAQIPISANYGQAKVILELAEEQSTCELRVQGELSDLVHIKPLARDFRNAWSISCAELSFVDHNLPNLTDSLHFTTISEIAAATTLNEVALWTQTLGASNRLPRFQTYFMSVCPLIQERSLNILSLLGFQVKQRRQYQFGSNQQCNSIYTDAHWADTQENLLYHVPDRARYIEVLERAILFASHMAFTDWNTRLQTMSASYFNGYLTSHFEPLSRAKPHRYDRFDDDEKLEQVLIVCTDTYHEQKLRPESLSTDSWIGLGLDGVVVLRTSFTSHSITKLHGRILSFSPGYLSFEGQRKTYVDMWKGESWCEPIRNTNQDVQPMNIAPTLQSRFLFPEKRESSTIRVRLDILHGSDLFTTTDPDKGDVSIRSLLVAKTCGHPHDTLLRNSDSLHIDDLPVKLFPGLTILNRGREGKKTVDRAPGTLYIYYQQVEKNDLGQWLACQASLMDSKSTIYILQENSCLLCILKRLVKRAKKTWTPEDYDTKSICIIAGKIDGS